MPDEENITSLFAHKKSLDFDLLDIINEFLMIVNGDSGHGSITIDIVQGKPHNAHYSVNRLLKQKKRHA